MHDLTELCFPGACEEGQRSGRQTAMPSPNINGPRVLEGAEPRPQEARAHLQGLLGGIYPRFVQPLGPSVPKDSCPQE
jgi:hypothetical protein